MTFVFDDYNNEEDDDNNGDDDDDYDDDNDDDDDIPHIWILGDVLKPLRELFDSVEVSSDPNMFNTSDRSDVFNVTNLFDHIVI